MSMMSNAENDHHNTETGVVAHGGVHVTIHLFCGLLLNLNHHLTHDAAAWPVTCDKENIHFSYELEQF